MPTAFEDLVRDAIAKVCNVDPGGVRPEAKLADIGVDSLAAAEVLVELEINLGRELPVNVLRSLDKVDTVGEIASRLEAAFGGQPARD